MKRSTHINVITLLGIIIFILIASTAPATTWYVAKNQTGASDTNEGTMDQPWLTIQHAAETAIAGDTVFIMSGIYNEYLYFDHNGNATQGHIVFSAFPDEVPVIDGTGVVGRENGIVLDKNYIKLTGLEIRNWAGNGIWIENAAYFEISDCVIHHVFYGIGVADGSHDFVFNRVEAHHFNLYGFDVSPSDGNNCYNGVFNDCISHTGRDGEQNVDGFALGHGTQHNFQLNRCITYDVYDGFDISSMRSILNRCLAYDCWNGGYKLWQDEVKLVNCIGYNCEETIVELDWDGDAGVTTLMNCTFYNAGTFTIWIENSADALHMYNCIIAGGDNIGLAFEQMGVDNYRGDCNIFHNENPNRAIAVAYTDEFTLDQIGAGDWTNYSGQDAHSMAVQSENNVFTNAANQDFHLLKDCPAIDNGTIIDAPSDDYDGNPRPGGAGIDIGAYEYQYYTDVQYNYEDNIVPSTVTLHQNYPNPFNGRTRIQFELVKDEWVMLRVFDVRGREVMILLRDKLSSGHHLVPFNGNGLASGVYFYELRVGEITRCEKMLLLR